MRLSAAKAGALGPAGGDQSEDGQGEDDDAQAAPATSATLFDDKDFADN